MTDHAQSGADAAVSAPASQAPVPYTDETYDLRKQAAQTLLNYLERSEAMLARCEIAMRDRSSDQFTAANTGVRIMKVGSDITRALMLAAFGETRHRSIVEPVLPPPRERSQVHADMDATMEIMAREMRALTEEIADEAEKDRALDATLRRYAQPVASHVSQQE